MTVAQGALATVRGETGTDVTRLYAESPLKLIHARHVAPAAWITQTNLGGGLVGGDAIALEVDVGARTTTLLTTQASTKVYKGELAEQRLNVRVHDGALACVLGDPVVCFRGAKYEQSLTFDVAPSAELVVVDWLSCGRLAFGERWCFDRYDSRATLRRDGKTVIAERTLLEGDDLSTRLQRFDAIGFVWLCGAGVQAFAPSDTVQAAISHLADDLTIVRFAAPDVAAAHTFIADGLAFLEARLGTNPWARKL